MTQLQFAKPTLRDGNHPEITRQGKRVTVELVGVGGSQDHPKNRRDPESREKAMVREPLEWFFKFKGSRIPESFRGVCQMSGNELFYIDDQGKRQDAELHEELLNNPKADAVFREIVIQSLKDDGWTQEEIDLLYKPKK
jgi:hypothetical protein